MSHLLWINIRFFSPVSSLPFSDIISALHNYFAVHHTAKSQYPSLAPILMFALASHQLELPSTSQPGQKIFPIKPSRLSWPGRRSSRLWLPLINIPAPANQSLWMQLYNTSNNLKSINTKILRKFDIYDTYILPSLNTALSPFFIKLKCDYCLALESQSVSALGEFWSNCWICQSC